MSAVTVTDARRPRRTSSAADRRLEACDSPSRRRPPCCANCATRCGCTTGAAGCSSRSTAWTGRARRPSRTPSPRCSPRTGRAVFRASIDGFHRPRAERYARGRDSPEGFYRDSFDYSLFRRVLVEPFRDGTADAGHHRLPAQRLRRRPRRAGGVALGHGARGRRAHRRRHLPASPRAAGPLGLVGVARGAARGHLRAHGRAGRVRPRPGGAAPTPATSRGSSCTCARRIPRPRHPPSSTTPTRRIRPASIGTSADGGIRASCSSTSRAG